MILILGSCVLASDAHGQGDLAQTDAEREFMSWNSTLPPRTVDGYHTAVFCDVANGVERVIAEEAGDQASAHRFELGEEKSFIFARRTAEQLGLIENHGASDSAEIRTLTHDEVALHKAIVRCRQTGLVFDEVASSPRSEQSETSGPDRDRTQEAIDQKFIQWSANWMMDRYMRGTAHIDTMRCGGDGCEALGHFSFARGGSVLTIPFSAQISSVGQNEYALGRLCYNDNTTGMQDCVD